jgi:DNA modification methylase
VSIIQGDARHLPLADGCVQCVVTSPPYWGLRDYGTAGQIGLETTPDAYVAELVAVFREVRRVLRDDGVLWLNLGSSYFGVNPGSGGKTSKQVTNAGSFFDGGTRSIPSRQPWRAPACGTDGTALQDWTGADSAYSGLCDECLDDFQSHRARIAGTGRPTGQSAPLPSLTGRDTETTDCVAASPAASLPDVLASTTIESWRQHRVACSRCRSRASALSALRASVDDVPSFSRMTWGNYTGRLKQKDLVPIPWMVAMALQADGWYLRSDIIWAKPNPMPESVTDRPTKAHEYVFLLTKSERYASDAKAIAEPHSSDYSRDAIQKAGGAVGGLRPIGNNFDKSARHGGDEHTPRTRAERAALLNPNGRNARTVWTIATQAYTGAHFATFPEALVERCVLAGSKPGSLVFDPFGGSGTTSRVAWSLGRRAVCTELNRDYHALARDRTSVTYGLPLVFD